MCSGKFTIREINLVSSLRKDEVIEMCDERYMALKVTFLTVRSSYSYGRHFVAWLIYDLFYLFKFKWKV